LLTGQALDDTDLADFHAKRQRASSAPAHSARSVLLAGKERGLAGFALVESSADVVRRRSASFRRKAPPPDFVGAAALPRVSKRCGYSDEAVAAIKAHEEFVRAARQLDVLTVSARGGGGGPGGGGGVGGGSGGGGGGGGVGGRGGERPRSATPSKGAFVSLVTRAPISAEGAAAAAAAAAASGGGMWAGMGGRVGGSPCHWSRRPDTREEDHERERAARMHLLRGHELQSAVQAIFRTSSSRPSSPSNLPPSSTPPPTNSPERMQVSPNSRGNAWTPGAEIGAQTRKYLGAPGSEPGHQASRPARPMQALHSSVSEVLDKFQRESPANIPPSALPFVMRPPVPSVETVRGGGERRASPARTRVNSSAGSPEDLMTFEDFCGSKGGGGGVLSLSASSDAQTPTGVTLSKRGGGGGGVGEHVMTEQKAATLTLIKTLSKREQKVAKKILILY
jgi:hypothetical protein